MKKVLIATEKPFAPAVRERMVKLLSEAELEVSVLESYQGAEELKAAIADAHGVIVRSDVIDKSVLGAAGNLELVIRAGAGYDTIDVEAARDRDVIVENTPGQNANAVAELAMNLLLSSVRPLTGKSGTELRGKTLAIHGFGAIGRIVSRLAKAFGMHVRVYDVTLNKATVRQFGVTSAATVEELYADADAVTLHIPENANTREAINWDLLSRLADDAVLLNSARAGIINEADLLRTFAERPGFRYAADVLPSEETLAQIRENYSDRFVATPKKQGAQTFEANMNAGVAATKQAIAFLLEGEVSYCVYKRIPREFEPYTRLATQLGRLAVAYIDKPHEIQITGYGHLQEFADVLLEYVQKGVFSKALGRQCRPGQAAAYSQRHGIEGIVRVPDNSKGYGNAITVDLIADDGEMFSTRGRIDEGQMEAPRIGEFKARMPLDPGIYVVASYREGPGMANVVGHFLFDQGFNRVTLGAGPNMDNSKAQAFYQVEKKGLSFSEQLAEVREIATRMETTPDVYQVRVIDLRS